MFRRLGVALSVVSLVLLPLTVALWARGSSNSDWFGIRAGGADLYFIAGSSIALVQRSPAELVKGSDHHRSEVGVEGVAAGVDRVCVAFPDQSQRFRAIGFGFWRYRTPMHTLTLVVLPYWLLILCFALPLVYPLLRLKRRRSPGIEDKRVEADAGTETLVK